MIRGIFRSPNPFCELGAEDRRDANVATGGRLGLGEPLPIVRVVDALDGLRGPDGISDRNGTEKTKLIVGYRALWIKMELKRNYMAHSGRLIAPLASN